MQRVDQGTRRIGDVAGCGRGRRRVHARQASRANDAKDAPKGRSAPPPARTAMRPTRDEGRRPRRPAGRRARPPQLADAARRRRRSRRRHRPPARSKQEPALPSGILTAGSFDDNLDPSTSSASSARFGQQRGLQDLPEPAPGPAPQIIVKDAAGKPVGGARVQLIARTGQAAPSSSPARDGRASSSPRSTACPRTPSSPRGHRRPTAAPPSARRSTPAPAAGRSRCPRPRQAAAPTSTSPSCSTPPAAWGTSWST